MSPAMKTIRQIALIVCCVTIITGTAILLFLLAMEPWQTSVPFIAFCLWSCGLWSFGWWARGRSHQNRRRSRPSAFHVDPKTGFLDLDVDT